MTESERTLTRDNPDNGPESEVPAGLEQLGSPVLDVDKYRPFIAEFDLTEEQERELLETLWKLMMSFVDMGFGLDPIHHILQGTLEKSSEASQDLVERNEAAITDSGSAADAENDSESGTEQRKEDA
jgi:hypothetical protein